MLTLLDQGLISGSNFLMSILLARQLSPRAYGAYSLAFEFFLLLSLIYGAMMLEPMSVFGSSTYRDSLAQYLKALLQIHLVVGSAIIFLVSASAWVIHVYVGRDDVPVALLGVAVATPCVLLFWLVRRGFYVRQSPSNAVLGGVGYFTVVQIGLFSLYWFGRLSPLVVFLLMSLGALTATKALLPRLRNDLNVSRQNCSLKDVATRHWHYGRWAIGSSVVLWASTAICFPLLASFRGLAEAGAMKALMNFNSPIGQVFASLSLLFLPYAAKVHHQDGPRGSKRLLWKLCAFYGGGTLLYWIAILLLREPLVHHMYAGKYAVESRLLPWVAMGSVFRLAATAQALTLRAMNSVAQLFVAYAASGATALLAGVPCVWAFGLRGAVASFVLSGAAAFVLSFLAVRRRLPQVKAA